MKSPSHGCSSWLVAAALVTALVALMQALASASHAGLAREQEIAAGAVPKRAAEGFDARLYLVRVDAGFDFWNKLPEDRGPQLATIRSACVRRNPWEPRKKPRCNCACPARVPEPPRIADRTLRGVNAR